MAKHLRVWIIDDDASNREMLQQDVAEVLPDAVQTLFGSLFDTRDRTDRVDLIFVDLSSIGPIAGGPHFFYGPICTLLEKHPGATLVINSAVALNYMDDVREEVIEHIPHADVRVVEVCRGSASDNRQAIMRQVATARGE